MDSFEKFKKRLRPVSFFDRFMAKILKTPASCGGSYCSIYDKWVDCFLFDGVEILSIDEYKMKLENKKGLIVEFWVANYPYAYGRRNDVSISHPHYNLHPSWNTVIKLREIQLIKRSFLVDRFVNRSLGSK